VRSRRAELAGYQMAIESRISKIESAVWLNTIISKLWRVNSGGLEPLLSTSASSILSETLTHPYSKPSAVAHVSLSKLSFGSAPPIISRVEMKGTDDEKSQVFLEVDLGMLMRDADILLGKCTA
jgi:Ca2+-dependent lipid-binding protein